MRHDENPPRAGDFTPQERIEIRAGLARQRDLSGFTKIATTFLKYFVGIGTFAILFNQTARDFVSMVKGLFK